MKPYALEIHINRATPKKSNIHDNRVFSSQCGISYISRHKTVIYVHHWGVKNVKATEIAEKQRKLSRKKE